MSRRILSSVTAACVVSAGLLSTAHASLLSTGGGLGVYDTVNDVTWTSDANLMATQAASYSGGAAAFVSALIADSGGVIHDTPNAYDPTGSYRLSGIDFSTSTGQMTYWGARAWVNYLDATNYGGSNRWALPTTVDNASSQGYPNGGPYNRSQSSSQLAQLFYGGLGWVPGTGGTTHNASYALFSNVQSGTYWSGTENSAFPSQAWYFDASTGFQGYDSKGHDFYALAVSPGQVSAVPLPAAAWLLLSGLGGLAALGRKGRLS